jgi:Argonaute linker 2 domain
MLKAYGIKVDAEMAKVQARKLPPPQLMFGRGSKPKVDNGEWTLRDAVFKQVNNFPSD